MDIQGLLTASLEKRYTFVGSRVAVALPIWIQTHKKQMFHSFAHLLIRWHSLNVCIFRRFFFL